MHKLHDACVSIDASVVLDFHLTGTLEILVELFAGRMLISDFVKNELSGVDTQGMKIVPLVETAEWELFEKLKKEKTGLGLGEIGAIVVAKYRNAVLLTNDKPARNAIEGMGILLAGSISVLEYAVEAGRMRADDAIALLKDMIAQDARISSKLVTEFEQRIRSQRKTEVVERLRGETSPKRLKAADSSRDL